MNEARLKLAALPEVLKVVSQTGRPDDGTDTTGFFNTRVLRRPQAKERVAQRLQRK